MKPKRSAKMPPRKVMTTPMEKRIDKARLPVVGAAWRTLIQKRGMKALQTVKPMERTKMTTDRRLKGPHSFLWLRRDGLFVLLVLLLGRETGYGACGDR